MRACKCTGVGSGLHLVHLVQQALNVTVTVPVTVPVTAILTLTRIGRVASSTAAEMKTSVGGCIQGKLHISECIAKISVYMGGDMGHAQATYI